MELDYARLDPALTAALENVPALDINRDNVRRIRELTAGRKPPQADIDVLHSVETITTGDGDVSVHVYRKSDRPGQPALLWAHGGGYIMGTPEDDRARVMAHHCDCTVFSVGYRKAPEHPFPAALEDCHATLRWMMSGASAYDIDTDRIAVGGASAGGGVAAGLALMNRDRDDYPLRLQLLLYPMIDNLHDTESGRYTNHPVWKLATSLNAWEMYLDGTPGLGASPYAAASRATDLSGLPPAYICVGAEDLFRDEDIAYATRLQAAGTPTELAVFPGMYHGGDVIVPNAAISRRLWTSFLNAITDALNP